MTLCKVICPLLYVLLLLPSYSTAFDTLRVDASLDTLRKRITGFVEYTIPSEPQVTTFEFQLYANLYSSEDSPYLKKKKDLLNRFQRANKWGGVDIDSILLDGNNVTEFLKTEMTRAVFKPDGKEALNGRTVKIFFKTRIPELGDRLSYYGDEYLLDGWFPSPAILQENGSWYNPKYGAFSELVGEYFHYEVNLLLPRGFKAAAPVQSIVTPLDDTLVSHHFSFGPAHDFALACSPDYLVDSVTAGLTVVRIFYRHHERPMLDRIKKAVTNTMEYMTNNVGSYAYKHLSLVLVNTALPGGIEFPGLIALLSPRGGMMATRFYESLVVHETVHQWFYGMVGSDQVETPWMDESITSFFTLKILDYYWGGESNLFDFGGFEFSERGYLRMTSQILSGEHAINSATYSFTSEADYFAIIYSKGALAIETFDNLLGDSLSSEFWHQYFREYRFKHPGTDDFLRLAGDVSGKHIQDALEVLLNDCGVIDYAIHYFNNQRIDSVTFEVSCILGKKGRLNLPVDYRLILENGDTLNHKWTPNNNTEEKTLHLPSPAVTAIIDPNYIYSVDENFLNNSITVKTDNKPGLRLSSGLMFLVESLLSIMGGM